MNENPRKPQYLLVVVLGILLLGVIGYMYFSPKPPIEETGSSTKLLNDTDLQETSNGEPTDVSNGDTVYVEETEMPAADLTGWETVAKDGYEFMHPGYFIKEENGYHIISPEPIVGSGEFSGLSIRMPMDIADIMAHLKQEIDNSQQASGINVTMEPHEVSMDGVKSAYMYEYTLNSGPNTGGGKFYALQSPYTDKWVTIQYSTDSENAEKIVQSFKFVE